MKQQHIRTFSLVLLLLYGLNYAIDMFATDNVILYILYKLYYLKLLVLLVIAHKLYKLPLTRYIS